MSTLRFAVSKSEINRRAKAFLSLAITWPVVLAGMSLLPFCNQPGVVLVFTATVAVIMSIIGITTIYFLYTRHLHTVFEIDDTKLNRITPGRNYAYDLTSVTQIRIKRTSYGTIRQASLIGPNWRTNIDGIAAESFENLSQLLMDRCVNAKMLKSNEPLNFDHPLFYPTLGLLFAATSYVLECSVLDSSILKSMAVIVAVYGMAVAIYMATARPLARQYGSQSQVSDYVIAAIVAIMSIAVIIIRLII